MIFNAYIKLAHVFPELENDVQSVLELYTDHVNPDIQQRAVEYLTLMGEGEEFEKARKLAL